MPIVNFFLKRRHLVCINSLYYPCRTCRIKFVIPCSHLELICTGDVDKRVVLPPTLKDSNNVIRCSRDDRWIRIATILDGTVWKLLGLVRERLTEIQNHHVVFRVLPDDIRKRSNFSTDLSGVVDTGDLYGSREIRSDCACPIQHESRDILCCVYGCPFLDLPGHIVADRNINRGSSLSRTKQEPDTP